MWGENMNTQPSTPFIGGFGHGGVTTTDVWKFLGLILITIDHIGLYFYPDDVGLRIFGRISIPIWFFLVGFSKPSLPPRLWLLLGVGLTLLELVTDGYDDEFHLNILLNYALVKLLILVILAKPFHPMLQHISITGRVLLLAVLGWLLFPVSDLLLEYGSIVWGFALAGFVHAQNQADEKCRQSLFFGLIIVTLFGFAYMQSDYFSFSVTQQIILYSGLFGIMIGLIFFKRQFLNIKFPQSIGYALKIAGKYSLELYAGQIFIFSIISELI